MKHTYSRTLTAALLLSVPSAYAVNLKRIQTGVCEPALIERRFLPAFILKHHLREIQKLVAPLSVLTEITVFYHEHEGTYYSYSGDIHLGANFEKMPLLELLNKENHAAFFHEFGHSIFEENLASEIPEWKNILKKRERIAPYAEKQNIAQVRLHELKASGSGKTIFTTQAERELKEAKDFAEIRLKLMLGTLNRYEERIWNYAPIYAELFADVIPVFYLDSGRAVTAALVKLKDASSIESINFRNFYGRHSLDHFDQQEISRSTDPHVVLAPVRTYLGMKYLIPGLSPKEKTSLIQRVFKTCALELKRIAKLKSKDQAPLNAGELNRSFITVFEKLSLQDKSGLK